VSDRGRVVLLGAGHAHLHVIDRAETLRRAGVELTVVAPARFDYSGMAAASATGALPPDAGRVDVAALARRRGVAHVVARATSVDAARRLVHVEDGTRLTYTAVSLNVGSVTSGGNLEVGDGAVVTKPLADLRRLEQRLRGLAPRGRCRVAVVGAGASGLELAGNIAARLGSAAEIFLFDPTAGAGAGLPRAAATRAVRILAARGVRPRAERVLQVAGDHVVTARGHEPTDLVVVATGLTAPPLVVASGLGDERGVPTGADLRHVGHHDVFAVGDCAHFLPRPLPPLGVYGVRAAPVLLAGLLALHQGRALPAFEPQRHALRILDLGAGRALAARGRWWYEGPGALGLKRRIDRRWLARYR
jgi:NADH dehydrogenase FAD-containing subunit